MNTIRIPSLCTVITSAVCIKFQDTLSPYRCISVQSDYCMRFLEYGILQLTTIVGICSFGVRAWDFLPTVLSSHLEDREAKLGKRILTDIQNNDGWTFCATNTEGGLISIANNERCLISACHNIDSQYSTLDLHWRKENENHWDQERQDSVSVSIWAWSAIRSPCIDLVGSLFNLVSISIQSLFTLLLLERSGPSRFITKRDALIKASKASMQCSKLWQLSYNCTCADMQ